MNQKIKEKVREAFGSVLPITGIVLAISILLVPIELGTICMFLTGAIMLVIGMGFFQLGAEMAMTPLGEGVGVAISKMRSIIAIILTGCLMGAIITIAEPDLQVLAGQVPAIPNRVLILSVAIGVGVSLAMAIIRILLHINLSTVLIVLYAALLFVSFFAPRDFLAVAFDSGGVTTGPITVPFIMAMGVGMASVRGDKNAADDSFGLVAISSIGPVLAVLLLGTFFQPDGSDYAKAVELEVYTTRDVVREFLVGIPHYAEEVMASLFPVLIVFAVFQFASHRYRPHNIKRILIGFVYTYVGLVLFLCGVNVGFSPVGSQLGHEIASSNWRWALLPIGMLIGYYIVKAEPAIQILNRQVEEVTDGVVSVKSMQRCISLGVSVSVGLAILRILTGFPIYWLLIPGYGIALVLSKIVPRIFVGIAFDSGGVSSGPMTTTFLLPLCIGACEAVDGNIMTDAFGVVALVALTPLVAVQTMGIQYQYKLKKAEKTILRETNVFEAADDIVEIEEETIDGNG